MTAGPPQQPGQPPVPPAAPPVATARRRNSRFGEQFGWPVLRASGQTAAVLLVAGIMFTVPLFGLMVVSLAAAGGAAEGTGQISSTYVAGESDGDGRILAVPVVGPIVGEHDALGGGLFGTGATNGYEIKDLLLEAAEDESIDGVVLEMDTPGGTIYGSRAIAEGVQEYQERTGKKVVAFVAGLSASGGMYAMAPADEIVADHGTGVGSIGVIFGPFQFFDEVTAINGGLLGGGVEAGSISSENFTAGRGKDAGDPFRELTAEERQVIQDGVNSSYDVFVDWVSENREIPRERIVDEIGAFVYDSEQAQQIGLVDSVANRDTAYDRAAELNELDLGNYRVERVQSEEAGVLGLLLKGDEEQPEASTTSELCTGQPRVLAYAGDLTQLCAQQP